MAAAADPRIGASRWLNFMELGCTEQFKKATERQAQHEARETDRSEFYRFIDKSRISSLDEFRSNLQQLKAVHPAEESFSQRLMREEMTRYSVTWDPEWFKAWKAGKLQEFLECEKVNSGLHDDSDGEEEAQDAAAFLR